MRECNYDGCTFPIFSGGFCKYHMERKPLNKGTKQLMSKRKESSSNKMGEFFLSIWDKRPHKSEISNITLHGEPLSTYFHHLIEKSDILYGELAKFDESNIILLSGEEHELVHKDMYRYEEVNKRRKKLLEKYEKERN